MKQKVNILHLSIHVNIGLNNMTIINKQIHNRVKRMIELAWDDWDDEKVTDEFIDKLIKAIQKDYWKFLKEDVEITVNRLLK